ncbi:hypothetical protein HC928_12525 [bacterium]|nr:hypothetical protein [bacterium]
MHFEDLQPAEPSGITTAGEWIMPTLAILFQVALTALQITLYVLQAVLDVVVVVTLSIFAALSD